MRTVHPLQSSLIWVEKIAMLIAIIDSCELMSREEMEENENVRCIRSLILISPDLLAASNANKSTPTYCSCLAGSDGAALVNGNGHLSALSLLTAVRFIFGIQSELYSFTTTSSNSYLHILLENG